MKCLLLIPVWVEGLGNNARLDPIVCKSSFNIPAKGVCTFLMFGLLHCMPTFKQQDRLPALDLYRHSRVAKAAIVLGQDSSGRVYY